MNDTSEQLSLVASSPTHSHGILSTIAEETDTLAASLQLDDSESRTLAPPVMVRQETLETSPIQRSEHAAELSNILGNAYAHINKLSGKEQLDPSNGELHSIFWEQYSPHAQIELDLELESNVAVQGDCLHGHLLINVNPKEPLLVGSELGKIRLLGLEWLSKDDERSVFYNFSAPLLLAAPSLRSLLTSEPDEEGFTMISVGSFSIPFTLQIPSSSDYGQPKGHFSQQGVSVRTVALVTLRVKYPVSRKQSIAHFFRECVLWPKVDPQRVLYPQTRPIQVTASEDDIHLTASLYPPTWVAGQDCRVKIIIKNAGQTPIKSLEIGLFNSITVFHPPPCQPGKEEEHTTIQLSKATLKVKHHPTPGHASAKGWWSGVKPGEARTVYHSILIPSDALSVSKGRLFEVTTFIRVVLPRGILLSNISVELPLVIVNAQSFRRPEMASLHPPQLAPDLAANYTMKTNALRQDRDSLNNMVSKIQLADNDQETLVNNRSGVNEDHSTNKSLGLSSEHSHSPKSLHFPSEKTDKMPPPYLTNFSRRVEEKRQQPIKSRPLQTDEYDVALLDGLDLQSEHLMNMCPTRGQGERRRRSSPDSEDLEIRTRTATRSPSPEFDEPIQTREPGSIATVPGTSSPRSDDSNAKLFKETPGSELVEDDSMPGRTNPMTTPMSPKRMGGDREALKCIQPSMPAFTSSAAPKFLTSNEAATSSLRVSSSFPSSGSVPKLGAVKERIKALEMRAAE